MLLQVLNAACSAVIVSLALSCAVSNASQCFAKLLFRHTLRVVAVQSLQSLQSLRTVITHEPAQYLHAVRLSREVHCAFSAQK